MSASGTTPADLLSTQGRKSSPEHDAAAEGTHIDERIRSAYQKGKEKAQQTEENFESYVRAHPIKSVLIASGVGLVFGVLLGRRR